MGRRRSSARPRTTIVVVQDRSGSMSNRRNATVSGYNEYVSKLREEAEGDVRLTLVQFNTAVRTVYSNTSLDTVSVLHNRDYVPGGMTALYDAVGQAVRTTEGQVGSKDKVVVVIMTDGLENSSREYRHNDILDLLEQKRHDGWEFIFFGAGEEAWSAGQNLGFRWQNSINYGSDDVSHYDAFGEVAMASAGVTRGVSTACYLSASPVKQRLETDAGYLIPQNGYINPGTSNATNATVGSTTIVTPVDADVEGQPIAKS